MLAETADEAAKRFGNRPVVVAPDGTLTYGELSEFSTRLAEGLSDAGLRRGDIVLLVLHSGADWLVAAVAANRLGCAFAGLSPVLSTNERSTVAKMLKPRAILAAPDLVDGLPLRSTVIVMEPGSRGSEHWSGRPCSGTADHDEAERLDSTATQVEAKSVESDSSTKDDPVVVCFTSGTTGTPKAAMYTESQLRAIQQIDLGPDAESIWDGGSPMLASTQFAHVGMSTKFPWYFRLGVTLHVMERWRADDALRLVANERMPVIGAIAPQLALMLRSPLLDSLDVSAVQLIIAGGAASPPSLVREVRQRFGAAYSIRYSSTESGGVGLATDATSDDESEWATVGVPRPGIEVRIADESDTEVPMGTEGELQIRSGATMHSYWNDPAATAVAYTADRWLRTGDLARMDDRGRVTLVGRRSDMYIRGGYNVFPSEVESVLIEHRAVSDVVVVPTSDDVLGEIGIALVVTTGATPPTLEDLRSFASNRLARYKLPERLVLIDEVPLSSAQKIDRIAARKLLESMSVKEPRGD